MNDNQRELKEKEILDLFDLVKFLWLRKWWILLCAIICAGAAFIGSLLISPSYELEADLNIGMVWGIQLEHEDVVQSLLESSAFAFDLKKNLAFEAGILELKKALTIEPVRVLKDKRTKLLHLKIRWKDPEQAREIINLIDLRAANYLKEKYEQGLAPGLELEKNLSSRIENIQNDINNTTDFLAQIRLDPAVSVPAVVLLQADLAEKQQALAEILINLQDAQMKNSDLFSENCHLLMPPILPEKPAFPNKALNTLIGLVVGFFFSLFALMIFSYFQRISQSENKKRSQ